MTVETRYFTNTDITYKGATCRQLNVANSASNGSVGLLSGSRVGIRVWKSDSSDTETEITAGTPVATVIYVDDGEYSANWACPSTVLVATDKIVVRVYMSRLMPVSWGLKQTFVSEALGATSLDAATWTVYYELVLSGTSLNFNYGNADPWDSRITNFTWSAAAAAAVLRRLLVGVGL
jgi:hypothetical protein